MGRDGSGPDLWEIGTQKPPRLSSGTGLAATARLGYSERLMPRILVVEDSASTRAFVRTTLESEAGVAGVEVSEATSGFDALRLLPRGPYDLVITDINMPDINGLELVQFMRKSEQHKHTPILLISTQSSERDRQRGLKLGANGYLAKPFGAPALIADVARLLAGRGGDPDV
jgi:two-component system chemotaxis response regulator CheY